VVYLIEWWLWGFPEFISPQVAAKLSPMCDVDIFRVARADDAKTSAFTRAEIDAHLDMLLSIANALGYKPKPADRVLDFGCGIGDTVKALLDRGFNAYGVDVGEWWGKDFTSYWHDSPIPPGEVRERLSTTDEKNYKLPYPDNHFDLIISSQVFEHVFNYVEVFREIARVMKPRGVSVHVFPGPGSPFEPHLFIPVIPLAKQDWWLRLWALVKRRHRSTWRGEYEFLRERMKSNNYPFRSELVAFARSAGVRLAFREELYIEAAKNRPWKILKLAERLGVKWALAPIIRRMCQRTMVITRA
jgi:SAM-dependent methyltransferase